MSISTEIDLLITNMIISSRLDVSFPVNVAKKVKMKKKTCQLTEYIDIALSDLVFMSSGYAEPRHAADKCRLEELRSTAALVS